MMEVPRPLSEDEFKRMFAGEPPLGVTLLKVRNWNFWGTGGVPEMDSYRMGFPSSYLGSLERRGFLNRLEDGSYTIRLDILPLLRALRELSEHWDYRGFLRANPGVGEVLVRAARHEYYRTGGRPWKFSDWGIWIVPRFLDTLVMLGFLRVCNDESYLINKQNSPMMKQLGAYLREDWPALLNAQAKAEAERRAHEAAVAQEREQQRQAAEAAKARETARQRVWTEGTAAEIGMEFGHGDDVLRYLVLRGDSRREIAQGIHAGEHRIARIRRELGIGRKSALTKSGVRGSNA